MMKTIWKFKLRIEDVQEVEIPADHVILRVKEQYGEPVLYALVDPTSSLTRIEILCAGTGHERDDLDGKEYLGTTMHLDGSLVLHWFLA